MKTFFREILTTLILAVIIFFALQATVQSFIVVGNSMQPTLQENQRLLISKIVYSFHEPERGDVIVFRPPDNPQSEYIKRVIALPGESVEIKDGTVYIYQDNNVFQLHEQNYIEAPPGYTFRKYKIPQGKYFVLGDNRNNSNDSHNNWTVPRKNIVGKAWLSLWPPVNWGPVHNYLLQEQSAVAAHE